MSFFIKEGELIEMIEFREIEDINIETTASFSKTCNNLRSHFSTASKNINYVKTNFFIRFVISN